MGAKESQKRRDHQREVFPEVIVESYEDVIVLSGALRSNFWETVHTAIALTLKRHPSGVIIDCSGLTEATPQGADTFRDIMQYIENHDARVIVAAVPAQIYDVLRSVPEVRSQLAIAKSVEDARRSLDLLLDADKPKKKKNVAITTSKMVVCLTGGTCDVEALNLSAEVAESVHAEIHLVYVVLVPRDLPLQAPLAKEEERAYKVIDSGKQFLSPRNIPFVPHIERGRDTAVTLDEIMQELDATRLVVGLDSTPGQLENNTKLARSILAKITRPVVFVRGTC